MFWQNDPWSALAIPFPLKTFKRFEFTHSILDNGLDYDTICNMFTFYIFNHLLRRFCDVFENVESALAINAANDEWAT